MALGCRRSKKRGEKEMTSRKLDKCKHRQGRIEAHYSYCLAVGGKVNRSTCKECRLFEPKRGKEGDSNKC